MVRQNEEFCAILIIHSLKNRIAYDFFSSFFKFIGHFVCEDVMECPTNAYEIGSIPTIWISPEAPEFQDEDVCYINTLNSVWENINFCNCSLDLLGGINEDGTSVVFCKVLDYLTNQFGENFPKETYSNLWNFFIESDIGKADFNLRNFTNPEATEIYKESKEIFENAYNKLTLKEDASFQYQYARNYCQIQVNLACKRMSEKTEFVYGVGDIVEECNQLIKKYPERKANVHELLGAIDAIAVNGFNYMMYDYNQVLSFLESKPYIAYSSGIYYNMAKHPKQTKPKRLYVLSYKWKKVYRTCYKVACMFESEKEYVEAIKYWQKAEKKLNCYISVSQEIEPVVMQFYWSVCSLISKNSECLMCIEYGEKALEFYYNVISNKKCFEKLYGGDVTIYQNAICEACDLRLNHYRLAYAYKLTGNKEMYEKHRHFKSNF